MPAWLWAILAGAMTSLLALSKISTRANTCCDFDCEDTTVQEGDIKGELPGQIRELYRRPFMEDSKSDAHILSVPANLQQFIYNGEGGRLRPRDADLRAQFPYKYLENQMTQQEEYPIVRRDDQSRRTCHQCFTPQQKRKSPRPLPQAQQLPAVAGHPRSELASPQRQEMSKEDSAKISESQYRGTESIPGNVIASRGGQLDAVFPHQRNITNPETSENLDCGGACALKCQYQCERPIRPHPEASEKPKCCGACGLKCQYQCQQRAGPQTQGLRPKRYTAATESVGTWSPQGGCPYSRIPAQQNLNVTGQSPQHGAGLRNAHSFSPTQRAPIPQNASHRRPMSHPELPRKGQLLNRLANINAKLMKLTNGPGGTLVPRVRGQYTQNYQPIRSSPRRNYGTLYPGYRKDVRARVDNLLSGLIYRTGFCIHVLSDVERFIRHLQAQLRDI
uniref:4Fe-4S ferredoxin-type domain-containing protein n=1 Tax=Glossina pallidipes TaxID=7398 RepID=A0A1A9Z8Q9_GLOPL